jgi:hypothetical protein
MAVRAKAAMLAGIVGGTKTPSPALSRRGCIAGFEARQALRDTISKVSKRSLTIF